MDGVASGRGRWVVLLIGMILGSLVAGSASLFATAAIESTNTVSFCASCHEMEVFHDTWQTSEHGSASKGVVIASCTDCHLPPPHDGLVSYLVTKGMTGTKDVVNHLLGREPDWIDNLERREHYTFESGCRKCHVDLVVPEIPLKAFLAHRDYNNGITSETCITCHAETGHGDLKALLQERKANNTASESHEARRDE